MRKLWQIVTSIILILLLSPFGQAPVRAELGTTTLQTACPSVKVRLKQTFLNDDLTRVNHGQTYESLLKNVLTPTNARLVVNRYEASRLVRLSGTIETRLDAFRSQYQQYKQLQTELLHQDCQNKPQEFYQKLESVRQARSILQQITVDMQQLLVDYQTEFERVLANE